MTEVLAIVLPAVSTAATGLAVALLERNNRHVQRRLDQHDFDLAGLRSEVTTGFREMERHLTAEIHAVERHLTMRIDGLYGHPGAAQA